MAQRIPASDILRDVAANEKKKLTAKNEYKELSDEYSATHPNAISDGDEKGKGDGGKGTIGTKTDIETRTKNTVLNQYNNNKPYENPDK